MFSNTHWKKRQWASDAVLRCRGIWYIELVLARSATAGILRHTTYSVNTIAYLGAIQVGTTVQHAEDLLIYTKFHTVLKSVQRSQMSEYSGTSRSSGVKHIGTLGQVSAELTDSCAVCRVSVSTVYSAKH